MYDVVVTKVHVRYLISWWVSCLERGEVNWRPHQPRESSFRNTIIYDTRTAITHFSPKFSRTLLAPSFRYSTCATLRGHLSNGWALRSMVVKIVNRCQSTTPAAFLRKLRDVTAELMNLFSIARGKPAQVECSVHVRRWLYEKRPYRCIVRSVTPWSHGHSNVSSRQVTHVDLVRESRVRQMNWTYVDEHRRPKAPIYKLHEHFKLTTSVVRHKITRAPFSRKGTPPANRILDTFCSRDLDLDPNPMTLITLQEDSEGACHRWTFLVKALKS